MDEAIRGMSFKTDIAQVKKAWAAIQKNKGKAAGKRGGAKK